MILDLLLQFSLLMHIIVKTLPLCSQVAIFFTIYPRNIYSSLYLLISCYQSKLLIWTSVLESKQLGELIAALGSLDEEARLLLSKNSPCQSVLYILIIN